MRLREVAGLLVVLAAAAACADTEAGDPAGAPAVSTHRPSGPKASTEPPVEPQPSKQTPEHVNANGPVQLSIPSIGVRGLRVIAYAGVPDDRPGDRIQDTGRLASPRGSGGGTGPGEIGNFIVTGHRTEAGRPFGKLPQLKNGDHVLVTAQDKTYDYVITGTMSVSFRKPGDKARQTAAVPGRPGVKATRPMITLSTCATPEDHAKGNYWSDALGNPEHRIDKVGVLSAVR